MEPYSNQILIDPYLFYGLVGGIFYLLYKVYKLTNTMRSLLQMHTINADMITASFDQIAEDTQKLSDGLDKLEDRLQYVADKQTGTTS